MTYVLYISNFRNIRLLCSDPRHQNPVKVVTIEQKNAANGFVTYLRVCPKMCTGLFFLNVSWKHRVPYHLISIIRKKHQKHRGVISHISET